MTSYAYIQDTIASLPSSEPYALLYTYLFEHFPDAPGSINNKHQDRAWWYYDHIADMLKLSEILYTWFDQYRALPFSLEDAYIVVLLHDIEKPFRFTASWQQLLTQEHRETTDTGIREKVISMFSIELTPEQRNGLTYIHGEWADYSETKRVMNALAAFCHSIDTMSARIYFDAHPLF